MRIKKVCQHCKQTFIAQKTVTKFCSLSCARRNYKKRKREEKITRVILSTNEQLVERYTVMPSNEQTKPNRDRLIRDWINIRDLAELLGIGERTLYRVIKQKRFPKIKVGRRLLFNKQCVLDFFISKSEEI